MHCEQVTLYTTMNGRTFGRFTLSTVMTYRSVEVLIHNVWSADPTHETDRYKLASCTVVHVHVIMVGSVSQHL